MKHVHYSNIPAQEFTGEDVQDVSMRVGITDTDGAPNFAMRLFHVKPGGYTPFHKHHWEHEVFVVSGHGTLVLDQEERELSVGDFVYVEPDAMHQFKNAGEEEFQFICVVPHTSKVISH